MFPLMYQTLEGKTGAVPLSAYPDGTPLVRIELLTTAQIVRLLLRPSSLAEFMAAMFFVDALADREEQIPHLILPIMPGGRQDRLNSTGDYLFTAKSVARELNMRRFPSVTLVDPHSDVTPALVERSRVVRAVDCITGVPANKYAAVISPDAGAEKRAGPVAKRLDVPLVHAWKTRDLRTGGITGFGMEDRPELEGELVLVVDDLCDAGGTFLGLGNVLRDRGIKAHLWTTHGLYSRGTAELLERYGHLYCTDSVAGPREGVIERNVCEQLLKGSRQ